MPEGGTIDIKAENEFVGKGKPFPLPAGSCVSIRITDKGVGIPERYLP